MKIAYISTGAAGMYCGTCIHDNTLASALMNRGHEVALIPTYTPTRTDEDNVSMDRIFFGGINIYLEQKSALYRHSPAFLKRLLNNKRLLNYVSSRFSASTDASQLGELTLAMLEGSRGPLRTELDSLTTWLRDEYRPDVVELNLSLFLGLAREIRQATGAPVLCGVQGEDIFLEDLVEPHKTLVLQALRQRARDVDGYVATSDYYAGAMSELLQVPREMFHVVRLGIKLDGHGPARQAPRSASSAFSVGYLARICPEKGLHVLVDAFRIFTEKHGEGKLRLKVAGWLGERDRPYLDKLRARIGEWGLEAGFDFFGEVSRQEKIAFLNQVDVLCVPTIYQEPKGLFALEAMANEIPVILPRHGAFPEMIERTRGGLLVEPNSPQAIVEGLEDLWKDEERRQRLGARGRRAVLDAFSADAMASATLDVYNLVLGQEQQTSRVAQA